NGKIDKKALSTIMGVYLGGKYVAPETTTEHTLVDIWSSLLKLELDEISSTANFFELGGNSLLLIRLISMVEAEMDLKLDLRQVYINASIRELSESIDYFKFSSGLKNQNNIEFEQVEF
ncbi:MAG: hypothetical protein JKX98_07005, partial [Alcanivoracaceae bacterium]|nr:hypothetical protein [Alcanivoracaceae bacterium]